MKKSSKDKKENKADMTPTIHPLHSNLLVEILKPEERVAGGIHIPEGGTPALSRARVLQIGKDIQPKTAIRRGDVIRFFTNAKESIDIGSGLFVIPEAAAVALEKSPESDPPFVINDFFRLPDWETFKGTDYKAWEEFGNIQLFALKINFLDPFSDVTVVAPLIYAELVKAMTSVTDLDLHYLVYRKDSDDHVFAITDDTWDCGIVLRPKANVIEFRKSGTSIENLHLTLPTLLTAFHRVLSSPQFEPFVGQSCSSITSLSLRIHQRIRLEGKGTARAHINNTDLMQQFLRLLPSRGETAPAALQSLGLERQLLKRIDLKFGFDTEIKNHNYRVFAGIEAPSNDRSRVIAIEWEIQDLSTGDLKGRSLGHLFSEYFKNVIIRSFYHRWFKDPEDVVCTTQK